MTEYRCWTEVSLGAIERNYRRLSQTAAGSELLCVVKADAYRHGAPAVAARLEQKGARWFGVANAAEGAALRAAGIAGEILILGELCEFEYESVFEHRLTPVVHDLARLPELDRRAGARGVVWPVHVKVDSGMGRLGCKSTPREIAGAFGQATHLRLEGLMSHLATTAEEITPQARDQLACFGRMAAELAALGAAPRWRHLSATIPIVHRHSETFATMVRPGLGLYGYPTPALEPALSWKARVLLVKQIAPGEPVGYGALWRAERPSRIAVLPCGYADGIPHRLIRQAHVLVNGCPATLCGAVSMDLISVDVTGCPAVAPGDIAILIGASGGLALTAQDWAEWAGTIPYVIMCGIGPRVGRIYVP
jgi:alanine racemase